MVLSYGTASTNPAADTDLGHLLKKQNPTQISPAKGDVATATIRAIGSGYSLSTNNESNVICSVISTTGTGTGGQFGISTTMVLNDTVGAFVPSTNLNLKPNIQVSTASNGTTAGILGTAQTGIGAAAEFLVTAQNGKVTKVIADPATLGSGYAVGDVIRILAGTIAADGSLGAVTGDVDFVISDGNISYSIQTGTTIVPFNGGSGHAIGDTLTLQEIGGSSVGTGTIDVATLNTAYFVGDGDIKIYPKGLMVTTPGLDGSTALLTGTVALVGMDDVAVIISGLTTGKILAIQFKEITALGTDITLAETTIFY